MHRGKCKECKKNVLAKEVKTINHFAHVFLVFLTAGIWLLPWLYIAAINKPKYLCPTCGSELMPIETPGIEEPPFIEKAFGWIAFIIICLVGYLLYPLYESGVIPPFLYVGAIYLTIALYYTLKAAVPAFMNSRRDGLIVIYVYLSNFALWGLVIASLGIFAMGNEFGTFIACMAPLLFGTFFVSAQNTTDSFDLEYESLIKGNMIQIGVMLTAMLLAITLMTLSGLGIAFVNLAIWKGLLIGLIPLISIIPALVLSALQN